MKYYLLLWVAVIIGQLFFAVAAVWVWQKKNPNINYFQALKVYFEKEVGTYTLVLAATIIISFILSDWMDLSISKQELMSKNELTRFEYWQAKFRTAATIFGTFAHLLAAIFFKSGKEAIVKFGRSKGVNLSEEETDPHHHCNHH